MHTDQPSIPSSTARAVARIAALLISSGIMLPLFGIPILLSSLAGSRVRFRLVMLLTPVFCRVIAACIGLHVSIHGRRSSKALVFVGNHVSYLDILIAGIAVGGVFVSRHDVKDWPVIGLFARLAGTVFLDRSSLRSAVVSSAALAERAGQGIRVALFPEGRTSNGDAVQDFKPFLFGAVVGAGVTVQPFAIRYAHIGTAPINESNRDLVLWYDPAPAFDSHGWQLLKLPCVRAVVRFMPDADPPAAASKDAVRQLAESLRDRVAEGYAA